VSKFTAKTLRNLFSHFAQEGHKYQTLNTPSASLDLLAQIMLEDCGDPVINDTFPLQGDL